MKTRFRPRHTFTAITVMFAVSTLGFGKTAYDVAIGAAEKKVARITDKGEMLRLSESDADVYVRIAALKKLGDATLNAKYQVSNDRVKSLWKLIDVFGAPCSLNNLYAELPRTRECKSRVSLLNTTEESLKDGTYIRRRTVGDLGRFGTDHTAFSWGTRRVSHFEYKGSFRRTVEFYVYRPGNHAASENDITTCNVATFRTGDESGDDVTVCSILCDGIAPVKEYYGEKKTCLRASMRKPDFLLLRHYRGTARKSGKSIASDEVTHSDILLVEDQMAVRCVEAYGAWYWFEELDRLAQQRLLSAYIIREDLGDYKDRYQTEGVSPISNGDLKAEEDRRPELGKPWVVPGLTITLVPIRAGTFTMGKSKEAREVTLTSEYWLGRTEVTQQEWQAVMGNNPSMFRGDARPVEQVTWADAIEFCKKLTERERAAGRLPPGYTYNLPTEAQWEYACRAGDVKAYLEKYSDAGWWDTVSYEQTHAVGKKKANAWGLYDMGGNVMEWCLDELSVAYSSTGESNRVCRGGNWEVGSSASDGSHSQHPGDHTGFIGFRLALTSVP